ncbi:polysaccharide pyruvyl transferase family protein [Lactiplantibacillus nangangensis]|uniref:Polysaccharide pyruvyl transferase family protein n=1 Tax=Lactiplantibacillus nangangensis TaxID=2559917 RepID=A0ABW1SIL6_9LACO|nr:polysaccharide pyruvyl transferase family protein [Lactiplantibacillus nangangensis]
MKKIGLFTLNGNENYGNRLQNFAVQNHLEKMGYQVDTILFRPEYSIQQMTIWQKLCKHIMNLDIHKTIMEKCSNLINKNRYLRENAIREKRVMRFEEFSRKYIHETSYALNQSVFFNQEQIKVLNDEYFTFFVGSDQVWNLDGIHFPSFFFLPFVQKNKRNSFSASFGVQDIDNKFVKDYKLGLSEMNHISVREKSGVEIVQKLSSKKATLLLDPVFLVDKLEWQKMSNLPNNMPKNKYILTYFLGKMTIQYKRMVNKFAAEQNLSVVYLNEFSHPESYDFTPDEFLGLISQATFFFTDSFHGVAFSIIFNTPFMVLDRIDKVRSMSTRIETILTQFGLMDRYHDGGGKIQSGEWLNLCDTNREEIIASNRSKTNAFLKMCFMDAKH